MTPLPSRRSTTVTLPLAVYQQRRLARLELLAPRLREWSDAITHNVIVKCRRENLGPDAANGGLARVPFVSGYWHQRAWLKRPGDEGPGPNANQRCLACTSHCDHLCEFYVGPAMMGKDVRHHGTHTSLATVQKILDFAGGGVVRVAIST